MVIKERKILPSAEFLSREDFLDQYGNFVVNLLETKKDFLEDDRKAFQVAMNDKNIEILTIKIHPKEKQIFADTLNLFSLCETLSPHDRLPNITEFSLTGKSKAELNIEMGGPLACGKTTLTNSLAANIKNAKIREEKFSHEDNPFLEKSYEDPAFMLRSQLNFLLGNIYDSVDKKISDGRWVKDTSVLSDIYVFMQWRKRMGIVTKEEHAVYMGVVELVKPLIQEPDLLILLQPSSAEQLFKGMHRRINDNPEERGMEAEVSLEDLKVLCDVTKDAKTYIKEKHGIKVFPIEIDPVEIYQTPEFRYATIYRIQEKLGLLKELLKKDPKEVAEKIISEIFAPNNTNAQVVVIHGKSMFCGKTSVLSHIASKVGVEKVTAFQPRVAIRYGEEHDRNMIDRDKRQIPAQTIESNNLLDIVRYIDENNINPEEKPFIFIDEVMLFVENIKKGEAIDVLEELRKKGFNVVVNGLDYTFQEEPFTFMIDLVEKSTKEKNWHEELMQTKCKYCEKDAEGSRRLKTGGKIADYNDKQFESGEHYEPVCCDDHKSCTNQPEDFRKKLLPGEKIAT